MDFKSITFVFLKNTRICSNLWCFVLMTTCDMLKSDSRIPKNLGFFQFNESLLKMMKNTFYFMLKTLFFLEIFTFLSWLFGYVEERLDKKLWLISKFVIPQSAQQIIAIHILPNISRSKGNQAMKFNQLIEYNMRNIFHNKNNAMEKLVRNPFIKNQNWAYLWINSLKCYIKFAFIVCPSQGLLKYMN